MHESSEPIVILHDVCGNSCEARVFNAEAAEEWVRANRDPAPHRRLLRAAAGVCRRLAGWLNRSAASLHSASLASPSTPKQTQPSHAASSDAAQVR